MNLNSEIEKFNKKSSKVRSELIKFNEMMAQYSVAIISLTIPFVGFLASENKGKLINFSQNFIVLPLYLFLFVGFFSLVIALIFGVSYRKRVADFAYSLALLEITKTINLLGSGFAEKDLRAREKEAEQLFKPISQTNRFLLVFFVTGILLILLFIFGSIVQLINV